LLPFLAATYPSPACGQTPIQLRDLPPPPPELEEWIKRGNVVFEHAGSPAKQDPKSSGGGINRTEQSESGRSDSGENRSPTFKSNYSAETRYNIHFDFLTQNTWRYVPVRRAILIKLGLRRVVWHPDHTIWFRKRPVASTFWSNSLVLHEFDHVRISSDPRLEAKFTSMMHKPITVQHPLAPGEVVGQQLVDRVIKEHLQSMYEEAIDLINIRYVELDRETLHGRRPLQKNSSLYEQLREPSPITQSGRSPSRKLDSETAGHQND